jgi:hypothetical protein
MLHVAASFTLRCRSRPPRKVDVMSFDWLFFLLVRN